MRKGGFEGHITEADRFAISIERFQSEKVNLSFDVSFLKFFKASYKFILLFLGVCFIQEAKRTSHSNYLAQKRVLQESSSSLMEIFVKLNIYGLLIQGYAWPIFYTTIKLDG
jgi:hypothetical protein